MHRVSVHVEVKRCIEPHEGDGHNVSIPEGCDLPEFLPTFDTWMKHRVAEIPQIKVKRETSKSAEFTFTLPSADTPPMLVSRDHRDV